MATTVVVPNPLAVTIAQAQGTHVSAAATNGMTVPANSYVVASFGDTAGPAVSLFFGPGQTVSIPSGYNLFLGGVVFTNI
jgi:hypothetical protein